MSSGYTSFSGLLATIRCTYSDWKDHRKWEKLWLKWLSSENHGECTILQGVPWAGMLARFLQKFHDSDIAEVHLEHAMIDACKFSALSDTVCPPSLPIEWYQLLELAADEIKESDTIHQGRLTLKYPGGPFCVYYSNMKVPNFKDPAEVEEFSSKFIDRPYMTFTKFPVI